MGKHIALPPDLLALIPPEIELGPAMKKLTNAQKLFVLNIIGQGSKKTNFKLAAKASGYAGNDEVLKVAGYRMAHDPRIQEAIREEARKALNFGTIQAQALCIEFMGDSELDPKLRLKAAENVLDRGGLHRMFEQNVNHKHTLGRDEKLLKVIEMCRAHGIDPRAFLGNLADVTPDDMKVLEHGEG